MVIQNQEYQQRKFNSIERSRDEKERWRNGVVESSSLIGPLGDHVTKKREGEMAGQRFSRLVASFYVIYCKNKKVSGAGTG